VDGSELKLPAPGTVKVTADIAAYLDPEPSDEARRIHDRPLSEKPYWSAERSRLGASRKVPVELIVNGKAAARQEIVADGTFRQVAFETPIERSSWVALRIYPSSHTNPIFVTVGEKPIRASKRSAEWCLNAVDQCWSQKKRAIRPADLAAAEAAYEFARDAYRKISAESSAD
jgi:hypothetical protein